MSASHGRLVLVRHGQSEWNRANLFTGWVDVDLSEKGIVEAREAGKLLRQEDIQVDVCYTSQLRRAIRTSCLLLSSINQCWVTIHKRAGLNEQHSGGLCGNNKRQLAELHGVERVMSWRRSFDDPPPPQCTDSSLYKLIDDARYSPIGGARVPVPTGESFRDCCERVRDFFEHELRPTLASGQTVLVCSHGNTLRALVMLLDQISEADISQVHASMTDPRMRPPRFQSQPQPQPRPTPTLSPLPGRSSDGGAARVRPDERPRAGRRA